MNTLIIGVSGAIGTQLANIYSERGAVYGLSRSEPTNSLKKPLTSWHPISFDAESSIETAIINVRQNVDTVQFNRIWIATGMLHDSQTLPEKKLSDLTSANMHALFMANTFGPALCLKHCMEALQLAPTIKIGILSARVGSIEDNRLGGWYSYRASKAALNMIIKTASIELQRKQKSATLIGCHPGTVDSFLSSPFQKNVPDGKLFSPTKSANYLTNVLENSRPEDSGRVFDWQGKVVPA